MSALPVDQWGAVPSRVVRGVRAVARRVRPRGFRSSVVPGLSALALTLGCASPALAASCTVASIGLKFGIYNPFAPTALDSAGSLTLSCSGAASEVVSFQISASSGSSLNPAARTMRGAHEGFSIAYNLYTDPARTTIWGDGSGATVPIAGVFSLPQGALVRTVDFYGRIPARQNVGPQSYGDMIVITVNF